MTEGANGTGLDVFRRVYEDRNAPARAWKERGGKVVGYFCDNVPTELIHAAGFLPYRISGKPEADLMRVRDQIDALYQNDLATRPEFVASMLSQLLGSELAFLDYLIIPHNRHAIQAIYRELQEAAQENPDLKLPPLHYMDKAWSPFSEPEGFNRNAVVELRDALEAWSGRAIDDAAIAASIEMAETSRSLLREINAARLQRPTKVASRAALWAHAAAMLLPPDQFARAARAMLDECPGLPERNGPRLFLGGSPFDHDRLYALIDALGATVVTEDHCWGARTADDYALPQGAPLDRLAARFHAAPACSIRFSFEDTIDASVNRAVSADVDCAIHYVFAGDNTQSWETPDQVKALRERGIPTLHLAEQRYDCAPPEDLKAQISAFLATVPARDRRQPA